MKPLPAVAPTRTLKIIVAAIVAAALALRVLPSWSVVFAPDGVHFQENDAWFHVRTVHNLLAHFPHRSGFDPYALFPGGQTIPTGPLWDYMIAWVAWILGAGSPSPLFIDRVAAWLPAILGALFPIPAFFLARRFFGNAAGVFAALWAGLVPGGFPWLTHLGLADHHAAEGFLAFAAVALLCAAIESEGARRWRWSVAAGVSIGLFLATRPAGIFVPAILACAAAWEPAAAGPVLVAICTGGAIFLPVNGILWSEYTWLALGGAAAVAAASLAFAAVSRRRGWPAAVQPLAAVGALAVGLLIAGLSHPGVASSLSFEIRRITGRETSSRIVSTVQEMQPLYRSGAVPGWPSVMGHLGTIWIPALPALVWILWRVLRERRAALTLFAIWSLVMTAGVVLQVRMLIYFVPVAAILVGAACAVVAATLKPPAARRAVSASLAVLVIAINAPAAISEMRADNSAGPDWRSALAWLRQNSPEPFSDGAVWSGYYPRPGSGGAGGVSAAWGVAVPWEQGYEVEQLARRVPMSNGTQAGVETMARFYTEASPERAVGWLREVRARYVVAAPATTWLPGAPNSFFAAALVILGRDLENYRRHLVQADPDGYSDVVVYLREYYRTMAVRLYAADGAATPGSGPWLFETKPAGGNGDAPELVTWSRHFDSEREAYEFKDAHPLQSLIAGCLNPIVSCFALPAVDGLRLVYSSDPRPVRPQGGIHAVKIFEVMR